MKRSSFTAFAVFAEKFISETVRDIKALGYEYVSPSIRISDNFEDHTVFRLTIYYAVSWGDDSQKIEEIINLTETPQEHVYRELLSALRRVSNAIEQLPTPEEARKRDFTAKLARFVDEMNESGIDFDADPVAEAVRAALQDSLKQLSENVITHQHAAE